MPYTVRLERGAEQELRDLPKDILKRVDKKLQELADNPRPRGVVKLSAGRFGEGWRIRVGNYRILYRIIDNERLVLVYRIKHRREAYRE